MKSEYNEYFHYSIEEYRSKEEETLQFKRRKKRLKSKRLLNRQKKDLAYVHKPNRTKEEEEEEAENLKN